MNSSLSRRKRSANLQTAQQLKGTQMAAIHLATYQKRFKSIHNPTAAHEWKKFDETIAFFRKYGQQYGFDHLMLAAQGYQDHD
jgi:hypothetical protein